LSDTGVIEAQTRSQETPVKANRFLEVDKRGMVLVKFGKFKGEYLIDVAAENPGYVQWMRDELDLPDDVKLQLEVALNDQ
jgi:uncharacterized protein (DUF3820 family)